MRLLFTVILVCASLELVAAFPMNIPKKLVLLDRDGVINCDVGAPGVLSVAQFQLADHAAVAIGNLKRHGCTVVVVTNQSCVGKGIITRQQLDEIHDFMVQQLLKDDADARLDQIYVCTCASKDDPRCKPNSGMILEAQMDFHVDAIDCVLIGDNLTDLQAAASIPLRILVATGYGSGIMGREAEKAPEYIATSPSLPKTILPFYYVQNLAAAVDFLMA
jgi:D-glycero-D-manno-heptose 1,7-bisphosphate phosphatase